MSEAVSIYVTDEFPAGTPVVGTYVGIHDSVTKALIQAGTSDAAGLVLFPVIDETINSGVYEIRIAPGHPSFVVGGSVQNVAVVAAGVNKFDVKVTPEGYTSATNPRLCRCQGYFVDSTGKPRKSLSLAFSEYVIRELEYISGGVIDVKGVIPSQIVAVTDTDGYLAIDLYRGGCYLLYMEGFEEQARVVVVPDSPSTNIADLVFPTLGTIEYYDALVKILPVNAPTLAATIGVSTPLTVGVILRSGAETEGDQVVFTSSDEAVATVSYSGSTKSMTITGVSAGTATITPTRATSTAGGVSILPEPSVIGALVVTVA